MNWSPLDQDETFIDIVGILERHKIPPDPDVRVVINPKTWDALAFDAELLGMRMADVVRIILSPVSRSSLSRIPSSGTVCPPERLDLLGKSPF